MFLRKFSLIMIFALATFALAKPVLAGGWAVITLDELPGQVSTGDPVNISFLVLQHGINPMGGLEPVIKATHPETGESLVVRAEAGDQAGRYFATLTFPQAGRWDWSIQAFTMEQTMPAITVNSATGGPAVDEGASTPGLNLSIPMIAGLLGLAGAAGALLVLIQKRTRWALLFVVAGMLVSGLGFATAATGTPANADQRTQDTVIAQVGSGQDLFIAKGCTTCHVHADIQRNRETIYVDIGLNLTDFKADPDYLRSWLKDPVSIKPDTKMPDLGLDEREIEALIAFINAD